MENVFNHDRYTMRALNVDELQYVNDIIARDTKNGLSTEELLTKSYETMAINAQYVATIAGVDAAGKLISHLLLNVADKKDHLEDLHVAFKMSTDLAQELKEL